MILAEWVHLLQRRVGWPRGGPGVWAVLLVLGLAGGMVRHTLRPMHQENQYYRDAARFIAENLCPEDHLLTYSKRLLYYVEYEGGKSHGSILLPDVHWKVIYRWLLQRQATHLALPDSTLLSLKADNAEIIRSPIFVLMAEFPQANKEHPDTIRLYRIDRKLLKDTTDKIPYLWQ